jgi:hypothetical protein
MPPLLAETSRQKRVRGKWRGLPRVAEAELSPKKADGGVAA